MTPEQLAAARATHWRQDAQPLLTLEEATSWLERMQLALYLPRKAQLLAPAPSFVEAVAGEGSATPGAEAIAQAHDHLVRMVAEGTAVPLNLFGTPGEQPDFLISVQALSHLAALQADRNWKKAPARTGPGKVSPLAIEIWKLLEDEGVLTAGQIREQLGHELTEAATIRGLSELWQNLRVAPLPQGAGAAAQWEILSFTHKKEMAAGGTMAQSAALSMMVSNYLQSIVTGTAEDVEAFLSPVASRSRLRDVVRGLTATRQLRTLSMDAQTFLFIDGTLPDMPEVAAAGADGEEAKPAFMGRSAYRERMLNRGKEEEEKPEEGAAEAPRRPSFDRPSFRPSFDRAGSGRPRSGRPGFDRPRSDRPGSDRSGSDRPGAPRRFAAGGPPSSFRSRPEGGDRSAGPRRPFGAKPFGAKPFGAKPFGSGAPRSGDDRPRSPRPFTPRGDGERPGFKPRTGFDRPRPSFDRPRTGFDKPGFDKPRTDFGKSGGYGKDRGTPRPFGTRSAGPPSSSGRSFGGDSPRPFRPRTEGDRPRTGAGRPFTPREGGRPPFSDRPRTFSDKPRSFSDRSKPFSDRKPFTSGDDATKNSSRAGFMSRAGGRGGRPTGDRPRPDRGAGDRPSAGRPRPPRADGDRPYTPRPSAGGSRPFTPRPRDGEGRPPRKFDGKPSFPRRDASAGRSGDSRPPRSGDSRPPRSSDSRPPRREGSGFPSNPNRPSRAPKAGGSFVKRDGPAGRPSGGRPSSGRPPSGRPSSGRPSSGGRPPSRDGKPSFGSRPSGPRAGGARPSSAGSPGRNPGGTGRPGGPRVGGSAGRPGGRPSAGRPSTGRPAGRPAGGSRPGGMKPPTRKPRKESDSE